MLLYLGFGVLVLALGLLLVRAFANANPAKLARGTRTLLVALAITTALLVLIILIASERIGLGLVEISALAPLALRGWALWRRRQATGSPSRGQATEVETDYLRMRLDHDTGTMSGTVRRGGFQGRDLGELSNDELIELWHQCLVQDAQAAKLLEAYFDRVTPGWREASRAGGSAAGAGDAMTREEASAILGVASDAGEAEIREAYHRLMMKIHPDRGGSAYLAAKINRAREMLLG
jgi:DnaJ domain